MRYFCIGEALIDFLPENNGFIPVVGGAPANTAACIARLNGEAYFIGKVGNDMWGEKIINELAEKKVDISYLSKTDSANTALAFVSLKSNGDREFAFYRNPSADMFLNENDIEQLHFGKDDILHFCSVDLIDMPVKYATINAIEKCRYAGGKICFDPNIRKNLWKNLELYKNTVLEFLPKADIIKIADDELSFIFDSENISEIANKLLETATTVIITKGSKGSELFTDSEHFEQPPFKINCIDTTGAGDSFIGAFLRFQNQYGNKDALKLASATSAIVCTKKGVLNSLPDENTLLSFVEQYKNI